MKKEEIRKVEKTVYTFKYKGFPCEIVFWTNENMKDVKNSYLYKAGGIWNSYIYIQKSHD